MKKFLFLLSALAMLASPAMANKNKPPRDSAPPNSDQGIRSDGCNGGVSCGGGTPVPVGKR